MPDAPLAIRQKTEAAVKAYLLARIAAAGPNALTGIDVTVRQEVTKRHFPRVVIEAQRSPAMEEDYDVYLVDLMVALGTLATEEDSATRHAARAGLLTEWLADRDAFKAFVNAVTPPVPDLRVYDIIPQDEQAEQTGEHWIDALSYSVPAQLVSTP